MGPNLLTTLSYGAFLPSDSKPPEGSESIDPQSKTKKHMDLSEKCDNENIECKKNKDSEDKLQIVWRNVIIFTILHSVFLYFIYLLFTFRFALGTVIFGYIYITFAGFGVTAGAHRLWSHKCYNAKLPLRIFLMLGQSAALQNDIYVWSRDHRVHHKFTDTDADPHNASRGFFFSHVGWLLCKKHPDVFAKGKTIDTSDLLRDPVVRFQRRYYKTLILLMTFIIPTLIPWYFWNENFIASLVFSIGRYVFSLNGTWLVNSAAHIWGMKPYDKGIKPTETKFVSMLAYGEGWHNYHHIFPWDYKAAELGNYRWNFTTAFLDLMAKIGWATELKTASEDIIRKRALRTGDGTWSDNDKNKHETKKSVTVYNHHHHHHDSGELIWGWGDQDMQQDEINAIKQISRQKA